MNNQENFPLRTRRLTGQMNSSTFTLMQVIKIILYGLLIYMVFLLWRFFRSLGRDSRRPQAPKQASGLMVKDEVCNTYLPKEDAIKEVYEGKEYYFCSTSCRQKFLEQKKPH